MQKNISISVFTLFFLFFNFYFNVFCAYAQLEVTAGGNAQTIIEQLVGQGVTVSNIIIKGKPLAYGKYSSSIFLKNGMILSTGQATDAMGSNNNTEKTTSWGEEGDTDLTNILIASNASSSVTVDACSISFDIKPTGSKLLFNYTFASEEYMEYVGFGVNDVFAFLISGENPNGGMYVKKNLALIPNTTIPVTIDNVNADTNVQYFIDNRTNASPHFSYLQYDGFTRGLKASVDVIPCKTYRLELKIADVGDDWVDSAVFIEKIISPVPVLEANFQTEYNGLVEGCIQVPFKVTRTEKTKIEVARISAVGTANVSDYDVFFDNQRVALPFSFNFQVGEGEKNFIFKPKNDNVVEDTENFKLYLEYGCNFSRIDSASGFILDYTNFKPLKNAPSSGVIYLCNADQEATLSCFLGNNRQWTTNNQMPISCIDQNCTNIKVKGLSETTIYTISLQIADCIFTQSITIIPIFKKEKEQNIKVCPLPPLLVEVITQEQELAYIQQGRKPVYSWTTGEKTRTLEVVGLAQDGFRTVTIKDDISGCTLEEIKLDIDVECNISLNLPNAFTPNSDGLNDVFKPFAKDIKDLQISIFNKWGELIHIIRDKNEFWDGYHNGKLAPMGVYVWQAEYYHILFPEKVIKRKGHLTLLN